MESSTLTLPFTLPATLEPNTRHALHLYTILIDETRAQIKRDEILNALHRRNIGSGVHYRAIPIHRVYQNRLSWVLEEYPSATTIGRSTIALPLSAKLMNEDIANVVRAAREVLETTKGTQAE